MLEALYRNQEPATEIVGIERPFDVLLIDLDTGEVLGRFDVLTKTKQPELHRDWTQ